ncbi:BON domain-containing protein [Pseudoduganella sp. GCM10020061]|uniref:BON domain-containing protein n=1 Tax=Pseudoduganella sp. GCM10020061 TaxID=3317345 RepID=UPI00362A4BF7
MTKNIIAMLLAGAASASFAAGAGMNEQSSAASDYKSAVAKCNSMKGSARTVCTEEARAARAHAVATAAAEGNKSKSEINKARISAVEADYGVARARCAEKSGSEKDSCLDAARKAHASSIADVRAGREWSSTMGRSASGTTATGAGEVRDAKAISQCEKMTGDSKAACLIDHKTSPTATEARADAARAIDRTKDAVAGVAQRTENAAERTADRAGDATERAARRTDDVAENAAQRTEHATERAADNTRAATANVAQETREAAATAAEKTERAAEKTGRVIADATVTTKVKGVLLKEEALKSLGIHVETEQGVVMLSGFVNSKQEADRAVQVAKSVEGVKSVKSAIKVK